MMERMIRERERVNDSARVHKVFGATTLGL
jgi:hypothetical protein